MGPGRPPESPPEKVGIFHLQGVEMLGWSHLHSQFPVPNGGVREDLGMKPSLGKEGWGEGDLVFVFASNYPTLDLIV